MLLLMPLILIDYASASRFHYAIIITTVIIITHCWLMSLIAIIAITPCHCHASFTLRMFSLRRFHCHWLPPITPLASHIDYWYDAITFRLRYWHIFIDFHFLGFRLIPPIRRLIITDCHYYWLIRHMPLHITMAYAITLRLRFRFSPLITYCRHFACRLTMLIFSGWYLFSFIAIEFSIFAIAINIIDITPPLRWLFADVAIVIDTCWHWQAALLAIIG